MADSVLSVRGRRRWRIAALGPLTLPLALLVGCHSGLDGGAAAPSPLPVAVAPWRRASPLPDRDWAHLDLRGVGLRIRVPDGGGWAVVPTGPGGFGARHAESRSELAVRIWPEVRSVTPADCEERARLAAFRLGAPGDVGVLERRPLRAPAEFHGQVSTGIALLAEGGIEGWVTAVGAGPGRCLAIAFTIRAVGMGAERVAGEALSLVGTGTFDSVEWPGIEDRVRRLPGRS